ncbi:DNA polymerase III subunit delta [Alkalicella caledoniensis]|uniref:DNA polymerase III subunit delta n=1 Tax=Alkalicella caledoniensis TaxID=2731377 RepID=A0A7G9W4G8_ALKCA|nr:DNA polymerase III subunit delta [Alkalicella caledoniensis]QNO13580.1 DNA polymerase III subunit delta [Alkalicella caledoniensis]
MEKANEAKQNYFSYLIYGDEPYLINKALDEILSEAFQHQKGLEGFEDFQDYNIDTLTSDEVYNKYIGTLETLPFMADKRVIMFKRCDILKAKQTKKEEEINEYLIKYLTRDDKNLNNIVIIIEGEKVDKRKKLFKTLKGSGKVVECAKQNTFDIKKWINEIFEENQKKIPPNIVDTLVFNLPNDMYLIENELQKLINFMGDKTTLEKEDLQICSFTVNENIFKLIESIAFKNLTKSISTLHGMLQEGEAPLMILFMIIKQLRNIAKVKSLTSKGYTSKQMGELLGIHSPYALSQLVKQSEKFNKTSIEKGIELAAEYEIKIKTGVLDYQKGLELLLTNLYYV